jgi:transcriptional regulator with XRE-family HTH domain
VVGHAEPDYHLPMTDSRDLSRAFGEFVRAQRSLAKISQRELAKASGVSDSYLSQVERGQYTPSAAVLTSLARAFGIAPEVLYAQFDLLDQPDGSTRVSIEDAIRMDTELSQENKNVLLTVYRGLRAAGDGNTV